MKNELWRREAVTVSKWPNTVVRGHLQVTSRDIHKIDITTKGS